MRHCWHTHISVSLYNLWSKLTIEFFFWSDSIRLGIAFKRDGSAFGFRLSSRHGKVLIKLLLRTIMVMCERAGIRLSWSHVINIPLSLTDNKRIEIEPKMLAGTTFFINKQKKRRRKKIPYTSWLVHMWMVLLLKNSNSLFGCRYIFTSVSSTYSIPLKWAD